MRALAVQVDHVVPVIDIAFQISGIKGLIIIHHVRAHLLPVAGHLYITFEVGHAPLDEIGPVRLDIGIPGLQFFRDQGVVGDIQPGGTE